jgi:hypothetical protein
MRLIAVSATLAATALLAACNPPAPNTAATAAAAATPAFTGGQEFVSLGVDAAPGCPSIQWDLQPTGDPGTYRGIVFFADLSGIGYANGTVGRDGTITGTVHSVYGRGPDGNITGVRNANGLQVRIDGQGCSNLTVTLPAAGVRPFGTGGRG